MMERAARSGEKPRSVTAAFSIHLLENSWADGRHFSFST